MSLQVWLPLNGDLTQQGLSSVEATNNGATVNNEGKIGKSYQFGTASSGINIPSSVVQDFTECSVAFWVKIISWNTSYATLFQIGVNGRSWQNYHFGILRNSSSSNLCFVISNGTTSSTTSCLSSTLQLNQWYHLVFTYNKDGYYRIYINGVLDKESYTETLIPNFASATKITLGRSNDEQYQSNCLMNDVRIYDHCLSVKEIKELSKGLILHYKFDDAYIESTTNLNTVIRPAPTSNSIWGGHVAQWTNYDATNDPVPFNEGVKGEIVYGENGSTGGGASRSIATVSAESSTIYTYSFYIKASDNFVYSHANFIYRYEYDNSNAKLIEGGLFSKDRMESLGNGWYRCWGSFTTKITTTKINISFYTYPLKNVNYWLGGWQIEKNDHMTPFVEPNTTRIGTIFDDSGYNNNSSLISAPILSTDSAKYSASTSFDGTDDGILIQDLQLSNIINSEVTYAFWIKPNGETGARSVYFGSYSGISWSIEKTTGNTLRLYWNGSPDETTTGVTIADNIWQHICITKSGTNDVKVYINGIQRWASTVAHNVLTFPTTYRIGRDVRSGDNTPYKGLMSDFRIYATALSANDILELYHTAASIDNQGNLFCGEVVE